MSLIKITLDNTITKTTIISSDLNTITEPGRYYNDGSSYISNTPDLTDKTKFSLDVFSLGSSATAQQIIDTQGNVFLRLYSSSWSNWKKVNSGGDSGAVELANMANKLKTARKIALAGDATGNTIFDGSANVSIPVTLADTAVTASSYGIESAVTGTNGVAIKVPRFTVDKKGRLTYATQQVYTSSDKNVQQNSTTSNSEIPILLGYSSSMNSGNISTTNYSPKVTVNPSTGTITASNIRCTSTTFTNTLIEKLDVGKSNAVGTNYSAAIGLNNSVTASSSLAVGNSNIIAAINSAAIGNNNNNPKTNSLVVGTGLISQDENQITLGKYNKVEDTDYAIVVGDGTSSNDRHNMFVMGTNGTFKLITEQAGSAWGNRRGVLQLKQNTIGGHIDQVYLQLGTIDSSGAEDFDTTIGSSYIESMALTATNDIKAPTAYISNYYDHDRKQIYFRETKVVNTGTTITLTVPTCGTYGGIVALKDNIRLTFIKFGYNATSIDLAPSSNNINLPNTIVGSAPTAMLLSANIAYNSSTKNATIVLKASSTLSESSFGIILIEFTRGLTTITVS